VVVALDETEDGVEISVSNEGEGIPPEELPLLFNRFFRSQAAHVQKTPGLGLGLYICRELVEAHGGRIWAESRPGSTTVRFTLPAATSFPSPSGRG
jgi:signal transduction histidine kinase